MKRVLLILLALVCILSCVGCQNPSGSAEDPTESNANGATEAPTDNQEPETPKIPVVYYDDYFQDFEGVSAASETVEIDGDALEIVTLDGKKTFHAKGVGSVVLFDAEKTVELIVEKAKLNLVVIMGQSNSGNHFENATADITCPKGTTYWWGNGQGINATAPVDFTHATKGFHSPLLAELYAQSVADGNPTKNVLVWHEGGMNGVGTSINGSSITGWVKTATDTPGTDYTVQMVKNCVGYYEDAARSDLYEIVSKGVYWLQGEGNGANGFNSKTYYDSFMIMWNKLKEQAGLEYMAILRVRKGGGGTLNNDIEYSTASAAQFTLANNNADIFIATTITENFTGEATETVYVNISNYITMMETYGKSAEHNDSYGNKATYQNGILGTTMKTLFGSNHNNHYGKFGYALIGVDAAYNMYRALHGDEISFTQATSSGKPEEQLVSVAGETVELDVSKLTGDLAFRVSCGSIAGTVTIQVTSKGAVLPANTGVVVASGATHGCVSVENVKKYADVKVNVTFTDTEGNSYTVIYKIKK